MEPCLLQIPQLITERLLLRGFRADDFDRYAEMMADPHTHQAHTAHTLNVVPLLYVGRPAKVSPGGALKDVAPTLLTMMGLPQPPEMTGTSLVSFS